MTDVFKEFSFRCIYCFVLYGALTAISYLNYGCQLEYFQGYQNLSQSSTFCYEVSSWQWLQPVGPTALTVKDYASKTWHALSLPCLSYFNPLVVTCQFYVLFHGRIFQVGFMLYQFWAFLNPAVLAASAARNRLLWHVAIWFCFVHFALLLNLGFVLDELSIETLDSELIKPTAFN
jgi:hypothetical protein